MMTKNEFMNYVAAKVLVYVPDELKENLVVEPVTVVKMNDQKLNGLRFTKSTDEASPTHYLDGAFDAYENGVSPDAISKELADEYMAAYRESPAVALSNEKTDFKDKDISLRVLDTRLNKEFLKEVPYMSVGNGLALVCDVRIQAHDTGFYSTIVNNNMLEIMGRDKQDVFREALTEAWKTDGPVMMSMQDKLFTDRATNLINGDVDLSGGQDMYIVSNESGVHGAAALFYPEVQEKIADAVGNSYYALPSSVHEFIIVPEGLGLSPNELSSMVRDANRTVVAPNEILSDTVLRYDRDSKTLHDVTVNREMNARMAERMC